MCISINISVCVPETDAMYARYAIDRFIMPIIASACSIIDSHAPPNRFSDSYASLCEWV